MSQDERTSNPSGASRVRARLVRFGAPRPSTNREIEPLLAIVRATHPKADLAVIDRAYTVAERAHRIVRMRDGGIVLEESVRSLAS